MPFDLQSPPAETIKLLATYITFVIKSNEQKAAATGSKPTRFHARTLPSIDILGYLNRILKYAPCGTECFLAMIIYLERISISGSLIVKSPALEKESVENLEKQLQNASISKDSGQGIIVDSFNIHRLLITSSLVSIKFLSDVFYTNLHVSRICRFNLRRWRDPCK
jgi:Cyclin